MWKTGLTEPQVHSRAQSLGAKVSDWEVCPIGEADKAMPLSQFDKLQEQILDEKKRKLANAKQESIQQKKDVPPKYELSDSEERRKERTIYCCMVLVIFVFSFFLSDKIFLRCLSFEDRFLNASLGVLFPAFFSIALIFIGRNAMPERRQLFSKSATKLGIPIFLFLVALLHIMPIFSEQAKHTSGLWKISTRLLSLD